MTATPTTKRMTPMVPRYSLFNNFRNELSKLFDNFGLTAGFDFDWPETSILSEMTKDGGIKIDLKDAGTELNLTAEIPGVELADMNLAVTPHYVSVSGEKKAEKGEHDKGCYSMERSYGYFRRVVPLPCEVDKDRVDAVYKDGVLQIVLPKSKDALAQEKKITIKAG